MDPRVAVVIITRNRARDLLGALAKLRELPERPRIVVVDNASRDGTPERVAAAFPDVTVLPQDRDLGAAARTAGVLAARAPYVAFCDDDSWWEPGSLARSADVLDAHGDVGLLAARVMLRNGRVEPACAAMAASVVPGRPGLPGPAVRGFVACGAVVRRDAYLAAGGFAPGWGVGAEEQPLAAALADRGWELVYVDSIVAQHRPSSHRDRAARLANETRNELWFAWRSRARRAALATTARELRRALTDRSRAAGVAAALRHAPSALRERRPVGPRVERDFARLARG